MHNNTHAYARRLIFLGIAIVVIVIAVVMVNRMVRSRELRQQMQQNLMPLVQLIKAQHMPSRHEITLPGSVQAWHQTPIFARTNGYIKQWYVDIGSKVTQGQLLAQIETPELDAQLRQAEANLKVALANNQLAQTTATRWKNLLRTDSVSKQATEEKVDTAAATAATVISLQANRDRLKELVGFERVIAPFNGIISDRRTDIGSLINAGSSPQAQQPLFRIVQIDPLRIYVKIPQAYTSRIQANMQVQLSFKQYPGQLFSARLLETAHAVDPATRTLLAQFVVENKNGLLVPGTYTTVHFSMQALSDAAKLPVNTLIFRKEGLQVATVDKNNQVVLNNITIDRDFGNDVEVVTGLKPDEWVIINPADAIYAGQKVRTEH